MLPAAGPEADGVASISANPLTHSGTGAVGGGDGNTSAAETRAALRRGSERRHVYRDEQSHCENEERDYRAPGGMPTGYVPK